MAQTDAAQRAEAARLLAQLPGMGVKQDGYSDMDYVLYRLAPLLPALLADAEALAAREAEDAAGDPPIVTPAVPSRAVTVRIVGRERVVSAKYPEGMIDGD